jgi:hypothetical protein
MPFATGALDIILGKFMPIPAPAGNELPLGYIRLLSTTTSIDWTSSADNVGDARLWVNPPMRYILDRLDQLEGYTGNPPELMMMGSASSPDSGDNTLAGTGTANQVAYWSTPTMLAGNAGMTYSSSGNKLTIAGGSLGALLLGSSQSSATDAVFESSGSMTVPSVGVVAASGLFDSTLTAHANNDTLRGVDILPKYAKSTFTGLDVTGLRIAMQTPTGSGTVDTYATLAVVESATLATANVGLLIGAHPGGSTNYSIYITSSNAMFLGSGPVRLDGQDSTGANAATFTATNKPGSGVTLTPQTWLKINLGGTDYYIPCWI